MFDTVIYSFLPPSFLFYSLSVSPLWLYFFRFAPFALSLSLCLSRSPSLSLSLQGRAPGSLFENMCPGDVCLFFTRARALVLFSVRGFVLYARGQFMPMNWNRKWRVFFKLLGYWERVIRDMIYKDTLSLFFFPFFLFIKLIYVLNVCFRISYYTPVKKATVYRK